MVDRLAGGDTGLPFTKEQAERELDTALDAYFAERTAALTEDQALDRISAISDRFAHTRWGKAFGHRLKLEREGEGKITDTTGGT